MTGMAARRGQIPMLMARAKRFREFRALITPMFAEAGIPDADLEVNAMLRAAPKPAGMDMARFLDERPASHPLILETLMDWTERRMKREPMDRIIGSRAFWTLEFALNEATLSPRGDTETLVEAALSFIGDRGWIDHPLRILDLGTGSGAILLSLLSELPEANGLGVDLSPAAIIAARQNALRNDAASPGISGRADFGVASWLENVVERFDLIVSNPPYIPRDEIARLDREVREHDPMLALDGGVDGLDAYRAILRDAGRFLKPDGRIFVEIGWKQARQVEAIAVENRLLLASTHDDLGGIARVLAFEARE